VPSSSEGACSSGIYGSHEGQRSQGANDGVSTPPVYLARLRAAFVAR
jgi:hypothetical protein